MVAAGCCANGQVPANVSKLGGLSRAGSGWVEIRTRETVNRVVDLPVD
jgi:hypothetical protein